MQYHVTNTFLQVPFLLLTDHRLCKCDALDFQTMILAMVGYLTFYFDIENFTDRVMVVLTTLLVIATITQTINQVHINLKIYFLQEHFYDFFDLGFAKNILLQND